MYLFTEEMSDSPESMASAPPKVVHFLELYQTKGKDEVKRPFGLVVGAQVITKTIAKGEASEYFVMKNEYGDVVNFKSSMVNPWMMGYNTFSKKMIGLRADG